MINKKSISSGHKSQIFKPIPPKESYSAIDRPVKIEANFNAAMGALLSVRRKPKRKGKR